MRSLLGCSLSFLTLAGCGAPLPSIDTDAGCGQPGVRRRPAGDRVPDDLDLGCVGSGGSAIGYAVATESCNGAPITVACTPASGATVLPPSAGGSPFGTCVATAPSGATARCDFPIRMRDTVASLVCPPAITTVCTGARTAVSLAAPIPVDACASPGAIGAATSSAPPDGFPVGATSVTFTAPSTAGEPMTCTTMVTVTDANAPMLMCPDMPRTIVRDAPGGVILGVAPPATDDCDTALPVTIDPMPSRRGDTTVTASVTDDGGNTVSCNFVVRVLDVFPVEDLEVTSAVAGTGGTDVTLGWTSPPDVDTVELGIERASAMGGPFTELTRIAPSETSYVDAGAPGAEVFYRVISYGPSTTRGGTSDVVRAVAP